MSFLFIFKDFKDFYEIVIGNIVEIYFKEDGKLTYEELDELVKDIFRAYVSEMKNLSSIKGNFIKLSPGWIDFDNRIIYYFVDGKLTKRFY